MKLLNKKITNKFDIQVSIDDEYINGVKETSIHYLIKRDITNIVHEFYIEKYKINDISKITDDSYFIENLYVFTGKEFLNKSYLIDNPNIFDVDSKVILMVKLSENDTRIKEIKLTEILSESFKLEL